MGKHGYRFPDKINHKIFFRFKKDMITAGNSLWRGLPLSSKSIYPVIGCFCDSKGVAYPSQQTIADLAGVTAKTVREGITGLMSIPWFQISSRITARGMRSKSYVIDQDDGSVFPFHKSILETGAWRGLSTNQNSKAAHAVYCVCRAYGFQDIEMYNTIEGTEFEENDFWTEAYPYRDFDFLQADLDVIALKAGVTIATARKAMGALEEEDLLEENDIHGGYKINLAPTMQWKAEYLNEQLKKTQPAPTSLWKEVHPV